MQPGPHDASVTHAREGSPSPAAPPDGGHVPTEDELVPLDPRVRTLWWITGAGAALPVVLVTTAIDVIAPLPLRRGVLPGAVALLAAVAVVVIPVLRYRRWRYALRPNDLWIRRGIAWVTVSVIPFSRLQFVDTQQGPLDRLFGLSQLVVHTAALGTSGRLPGLDAAEAERLRERLAEVEPSDAASV